MRSSEHSGHNGCYKFGPTRFSVIPKTAVGNFSIRFVPQQDAQHLINCFKRHIDAEFAKLHSGNRVTVRVVSVGDWWEADPSSDMCKIAARAISREWGTEPLYVREGGTMPVARVIEHLLQVIFGEFGIISYHRTIAEPSNKHADVAMR